jgi:glycosyltransferase involved in cell wall biosynthesis
MIRDLVSIIIPTYNRGYILETTIDSVLSQEYPDFEILIVDDGSTDSTEEIVRSKKDARISYIKHDRNKGISSSRNTGLRKARGEYMAFLDSDDLWYPQKLVKQIEVFIKYPKADFVFTNGYYKKEGDLLFKTDKGSSFLAQDENHFPLKDIVTLPSSWMFRKSVFEKTGGFDESFFRWEDGDFFVRAAKVCRVYFLNEPLVYWRSPQENLDILEELDARKLFFEKHKNTIILDREYYYRFVKTMGKDYLKRGKKNEARICLKYALGIRPFDLTIWGKMIRTFFVGKQ